MLVASAGTFRDSLCAALASVSLGRRLGLGDGARGRVDRLLVAIGTRHALGQLADSSRGAAASVPATGRALDTRVERLTRAELSRFVYELLDAHDDTARIAREHDSEVLWEAHLDYLRALQRKGRELLAVVDGSTTRPAG